MAVISVLGGGGFIGANLTQRLVRDGHRVRAVDVHFPKYRQAALSGADCWTLDLTSAVRTHDAIDGADWVFHLAADMGGVGYFHSDADLGASLVNGRITHNVIEAVMRCGTERVFYAASACAYPIELMTPGSSPLTEDRIGHGTPDALYGAEKLHGLRLMGKLPQARVGVFDTIYGPLQEHEGRRMKFPAAAATKALTARTTGRLELWGDGSQSRCYLYIDDAIDRILKIMGGDNYGPLNVGSTTPVTCYQIARLCLRLAGADAEIVTNPAEPSGVLARALDPTRFDRYHGPLREREYQQGFAEFIDWLEGVHHA